MTFNEICGLPDMTLEEELAMPENMKETKLNKIMIASKCASMERAINKISYRARYAPLKNDPEHAEMVAELARLVKEAEKALWRAAEYGII